jgi:transposase
VGYDAGKKVKGRKIHALVDTEGLPMRIVVHSAALQDRDGAGLVLDKIRRRFPWLELIWADGGYNAWQVEAAAAKVPVLRVEIVKRSDDMKGFVVLPRRWVVERTFSWFGRNRRLAKDFENLAETLATFGFTIARTVSGSMPEGRVQFLTHHTEPLVWRPGFLDHPNGARALTGLWIAAADPAEPAERFARFTGRPATRDGAVTTIALDRGAVHVAAPEFLGEALGITPAGRLPGFVAAQIAVTSLAGLAAHLDAAQLPYRQIRLKAEGDAIAVTLPAAIGETLLFHAA